MASVRTGAPAHAVEAGRRSQRGRRRRGRRLRWIAGLVTLVIVGITGYVAVTFVQVWSASARDGARPADAIVVLGAAQYDCNPSPVLRQRLDHALSLYNEGLAPSIVVTGGKQAGDRCTEAKASADYLAGEGVPDAALLLEVDGTNTWESLAASARFLRESGATKVVLVTDGYHALRVNAIAEELGLDASVSPSDRTGSAGDFIQETAAVAVGRIIGFGRLVNIDAHLDQRMKLHQSAKSQSRAGSR